MKPRRKPRPPPILARKAFTVSRLAEFASQAELTKQVGHPVELWPEVILKELIDNSLDAAEEAGQPPRIAVTVDVAAGAITIEDQGPGIAAKTVDSLIDYSKRTSSRALYVSPSRGAQGNALQSILAMAYVLDGTRGETIIESRGVKHTIVFAVDPVRQTPRIERLKGSSTVKNGARVAVRLPDRARSMLEASKRKFIARCAEAAWLNPHASVTLAWDGDPAAWQASDTAWTKWRPDMPTSPHWYDAQRLYRLMAAEIAWAEDRRQPCPSLRDFVRQFRGLSSTVKVKQVCEGTVASGESLAAFHARGLPATMRLLGLMRAASRPVKPRDLGVLGKEHLAFRFDRQGADEETFQYRVAAFEHEGLPYVIEAAFALYEPQDEEGATSDESEGDEDGESEDESEGDEDDEEDAAEWWNSLRPRKPPKPTAASINRVRICQGFNFTPAIGGSPFDLGQLLGEQMLTDEDPVIVFVHVVSPRLDFLDRGKARVALPYTVKEKLEDLVKAVTDPWRKQRKAEERDRQAVLRRREKLAKRERPMNLIEAVEALVVMDELGYRISVMEDAYLRASANGTLPANARQIYYAARRTMLELTGRDTIDSKDFTQRLLIDYMRDHSECERWRVAFDARGALIEPHTRKMVDLGTLEVEAYIGRWFPPTILNAVVTQASVSTAGPQGRYSAVLFVEKEGFNELLAASEIADRFDIAIMSTKGMSVSAARRLVDALAAHGVKLFVLHDFDITGFSIRKTLTESGRRHQFVNKLDYVDIGLRLDDVERLGLESERVAIDKDPEAVRRRLLINGATEAECRFLLSGQRVELNAMTSDQFVAFIEEKLVAHGVRKVVPDDAVLVETFAAMTRAAAAIEQLHEQMQRLRETPVETPEGLADEVRRRLEAEATLTWDEALIRLVGERRR